MSNISDSDMERLKTIVEEFVRDRSGVTFVELETLLGEEIETEGPYALTSTTDENINFWVGMSDAFERIVSELLDEERIKMRSTSPMTYILDGKALDMDTVKQPPEAGYKSDRWLPVAFYAPDDPEPEYVP